MVLVEGPRVIYMDKKYPFQRQLYKMVKHTQTIRQL